MSKHEKARDLDLPPRTLRSPWDELLLVCARCSKRAGEKDLPKGERVAGRLKAALRASGERKRARITKTSCLDLCPKGRIVVGRASPGAPFRLALVAPGTEGETVLAALRESGEPAEE